MNHSIRTVIIDDEPFSRDELTFLLQQHNEIDIVAEADSGEKGLELVIKHEPDVIFVDIEMPQMSGLDLATALQSLKKVPLIIFATAYPNYAAKAFRVQALDYLVKPFAEEQIGETIARIRERLSLNEKVETPIQPSKVARLAVEDEGRIVYLLPNDITFVFREARDTRISTNHRTFSTKTPIKDLEEKLKGYPFFRTHKSYLVNLDKVEQLIPWFNGAYQLKVTGQKQEIPVSRNYVKALRERLEL
ncbi:LytR/AlgR family response regulator transcription factor [Halalkalibacter akibai]|uniref:Autolysis response regulater LytR n=1 Tax=Halalkalibacter akibai (strain ATCC 43226 / DSM 21942 / CIP 109018 / JCM 9157 / 1139) TaxID=1236973 RepID=W4QRU5_HALA3|nr:LytTR family DNA-binding domain-containing protein [Halalkalibacter akibai]GAE34825.1 autolysis response regulater LytR [Halalkalibacter akibai JCM 9157]